jgi:hypothetical protein
MTQKQKQKINEKINSGNRNRINTGQFFHRIMILNKVLLVFVLLIVGYFVVSTNDLSIKGFVLHDLQLKTIEITADNKKTELRIMELESYDKIDKRAKELKMVKVERIDYITVSADAVAKR